MLRFLIITLLVLFLVIGASFGYFNAKPVEFNYLAGTIELPLIALIIGEFVIAVLLTLLICFGRMLSLKNEIRRLRKQVQASEAELKNLRDLPIRETPATAVAPPAPP